MTSLIWWIRRDLRLSDNTALHAALSDSETVIPVFVLDDRLLRSARVRGPRIAWMLDGLRALDANLRQRGAQLVVRRGDPAGELARLCAESGAQGVYFNRDYSPYAARRDARVRQVLEQAGYTVRDFADLTIHEADEVQSQSGRAYEVYTPFSRAWAALPKPPVLEYADQFHKLRVPTILADLPLPDARDLDSQPASDPICLPGEARARTRLDSFMRRAVYAYADQRNRLDTDGTSILSPYLRWGMISVRSVYRAAREALAATEESGAQKGVNTWISELVWREFNYHILWRNPHIVRRSFRLAFDQIRWENNQDWFAAWQAGQTGYPVVDAAMRQLNATGWMHNRARMIAASFLCKDLLIDWRWGEQYFMQRLLDGDTANNVGGWQWTAGTGTDAAPYFRVFNPLTQSQKFDPDGRYLRRWLPELADVPTKYIHEPNNMPADLQLRYNLANPGNLGQVYPLPLVDHAVQRERVLALYSAART